MRLIHYITLMVFVLFWSSSIFAESKVPPNCGMTQSFNKYVDSVKMLSVKENIPQSVVDHVLSHVKCDPLVLQKANRPMEFTTTFQYYKSLFYTQDVIDKSVAVYKQYQSTFQDVWERYHVDPSILLALWSIESHFGKKTGDFSVVNSLATMGFGTNRKELFTGQLISVMKAVQYGYIDSKYLYGSWAGAMGQFQFMPTTYLNYAQDGNGDNMVDIWSNPTDSIYSAANYLSKMNWFPHQVWGVRVHIPEHLVGDNKKMQGTNQSLQQWVDAGYVIDSSEDISNISAQMTDAVLLLPYKDSSKGVLVFHNFYVLKKWNRATYFDIVVGMLAVSIHQRLLGLENNKS